MLGSTAHACPTKIPEGLSSTKIIDNIINNGLSMSVTQVESGLSVNDILDKTEKLWKEEGYKVKRNTALSWEIVSALTDKLY